MQPKLVRIRAPTRRFPAESSTRSTRSPSGGPRLVLQPRGAAAGPRAAAAPAAAAAAAATGAAPGPAVARDGVGRTTTTAAATATACEDALRSAPDALRSTAPGPVASLLMTLYRPGPLGPAEAVTDGVLKRLCRTMDAAPEVAVSFASRGTTGGCSGSVTTKRVPLMPSTRSDMRKSPPSSHDRRLQIARPRPEDPTVAPVRLRTAPPRSARAAPVRSRAARS
jgi:hypothetical protein